MPIQTITCERCGLPIERATAQDIEGYLYTGRCRACRVGLKTGLVGMIENILAGPTLERS